MSNSRTPLTYADSGVDIDVGNRLVDRIRPLARSTRRPGANAELGGPGHLRESTPRSKRCSEGQSADYAEQRTAERIKGFVHRHCNFSRPACKA